MCVIECGTITTIDGSSLSELYEIREGATHGECLQADNEWLKFSFNLYKKYEADGYTDADIEAETKEEHSHWSWVTKYGNRLGKNSYLWFRLLAEGHCQAMMIVFHPERSRIDNQDVFYIEYLAIAPWNRNYTLHDRRYRGLGKIMIKAVSKHLKDILPYRHGFSLHALPQADDFYTNFGMECFGPDRSKCGMNYYEMEEDKAKELASD